MTDFDSMILPPDFCKSKDHAPTAHKYDYGHLVIYGGTEKSGAARLAGLAALRVGAGLVTISCRSDMMSVYQLSAPEFMIERLEETARFVKHIEDERRNTVLIGPGAGLENRTALRKAVMDSLRLRDKVTVLDADALTVIADESAPVFKLMHENTVLTPHKGEFDRLFPDLADKEPVEAANEAAKRTGAIIILKTNKIIVTKAEQEPFVSYIGSPWLASGGTGDVLSGMVSGLCSWYAHENKHEAVMQAVWMHGMASHIAGAGLIASDLPSILPQVWASI